MKCRFDGTEIENVFVDLVASPASNSFLSEEQLNGVEPYYPLKLFVNSNNWLVQIDEYKKADDIFGDEYVYYSSFSKSWLKHAENYVDLITEKLHLNDNSLVVEVAANDGYLLQYFLNKKIPCYGVEPSKGPADIARDKGIDIVGEYFGEVLSKNLAKKSKADLIIGNNVFAHVPEINDFIKGLKYLLKDDGVITLEFPHLMELVDNNQFDTIYHEHFYYFSLLSVIDVMNKHELKLFHVEQLVTHGGSLRIYIQHKGGPKEINKSVERLLNIEKTKKMDSLDYYANFQNKVNEIKNKSLLFMMAERESGKTIAGYGAAAKGNTYLNYCGIKSDLIDYVVDASPHKQGMFLPGSHIKVVSEERIKTTKPDYVLILPWNLKEEIAEQLSYIREWGGKFIVTIPHLEIF